MGAAAHPDPPAPLVGVLASMGPIACSSANILPRDFSSGSNIPLTKHPFHSNGAPHEEGRRHEGHEGEEGRHEGHEDGKKVSVIANSKNARSLVFEGSKAKAATGMTAEQRKCLLKEKIDDMIVQYPAKAMLWEDLLGIL